MSKRIISVIISLLLIASIGTLSVVSAAAKTADSDSEFSLSDIRSKIDLASIGDNDFDPDSDEVRNYFLSEAEKLPDSLDLRNYNGINYVTPVKFQNPFGTCWAFGMAGASEISFLYENGLGVPAGEANNTVDFSEKYISWYIYHGIVEDDVITGAVRASQIGEGYDVSEAEADNINAVYDFGGLAAYGSNFYASGHGPVLEDYEVDGSYPYYYAGKNLWRQCDREMTDEVAAIRQAYFKEYYRALVDDYIKEGYIQSADEYDDWFDENWGEGFFLYTKSFARSNYAGYDDWSLPLNAEYRFPGVASYFKNSYILPSVSDEDSEGNYVFNPVGIAAIKTELAKGHGVALSYLADQSKPNQEIGDAGYLNTTNWAQYYNGKKTANHAVTIVGYDDNYPKENFTRMMKGEVVEGSTPPSDGALIIKNSWGGLTEEDKATVTYDIDGNPVYVSPDANAWGYEDSGYFYLSYYDHSISNTESFEFYQRDKIKYYELNYDQYDLLQAVDYNDFGFDDEIKTANVFDAEEDEFLCQISYMTANPMTTVHYAVYKNVEDGNPCSGTLLEEGENTHTLGGYQRIDLKKEYFLRKGETYSVVITQKHQTEDSEESDIVFSCAYEQNDGVTITGVINPGESYMMLDDSWIDLSDEEIKDHWIDVIAEDLIAEWGEEDFYESIPKGKDGLHIDNFPIKAFLAPASVHGYPLGDADEDYIVSILDATAIQKKLASFTVEPFNETAADVDKDKIITILDATYIQKYLASLPCPEGIGEAILDKE